MPILATQPSTQPWPPAIVQAAEPQSPLSSITPGAVWKDDRGQEIQAHGGGVLRVGDTFYWFGEDRTPQNLRDHRYVACYSSQDLMNWTFRKQVVASTEPTQVPSRWWTIERPKVFYNAKTNKFVLYGHIDSQGYKLASVAVFTSDTVDGDYQFVRLFRPLGLESRDIGQFIDDDGSAYLIFESRPTKGFFIAQLSDDYLDVARKTCFIKEPMEGGSLVHHDGMYYIVASWMTGWAANNNQYASAPKLEGPWSAFKNIAPPATKTYGSQSAFLLSVVGSKQSDVIFIGDQWKARNLPDSRYLWMPLEIGGGQLSLPAPKPWAIDVKTGVVTYK
jgi:hypothetical protein